MAIERKSANSKSSILQKAKNANTKNAEKATAKTVKKAPRANVRKKLSDEEIKESEKAKSALNVDLNSPLLNEEQKPVKEEILDKSFTETEDGEDLKSINIGRVRKTKKKAEKKEEIEKKAKEDKERKEAEELEDKAILEAARQEYEESQKEALSPNLETSPEEYEQKLEKKQKDKKPLAWNFTLKPASLIFASFIAFIGLGVFFTFGLIVGKDLTPVGEAVALESISSNTRNTTVQNTETLKAEELQYAGELKVAPAIVEPEIEETQIISATIDPVTGQLVAISSLENPQVKPTEITPPAEAAIIPVEPIKYDFSLRAVSYTDESQADALRQKLEGDGMRTQLITEKKNNKTWYYVHINFRGTEEAFNTMRSGLSKYRIGGTSLTSKTEVK